MSERTYTNARGLYPFQARLSAAAILKRDALAVVDAGLGKTHLALATAGWLLDEGQIDHALFICERNKLDEWADDFGHFTSVTPNVFHGPRREMTDDPVLLSTYATFRDWLVEKNKADRRAVYPGEGIEFYRGKRVMFVFDEVALLGGSRTSQTFQAFKLAVDEWDDVRSLGLTATPMTRCPENFYNLSLIISPGLLGTLKSFRDRYVVKLNRWEQPSQFAHLEELEQRLAPIMLRKRKTDEDVKHQFPAVSEKFVSVKLHQRHAEAYRSFDRFISHEVPESDQLPGFRALNAFVCHPRAVLNSGWKWALEWAESYGFDRLEKMPSYKSESVIGYVQSVIDQEGQPGVIVFAHSVTALRCLAHDIESLRGQDRFEFVQFHGGQTEAANRAAKEAFREGRTQVMLASSKAERGVNLPEAHYIVNYDAPSSHASYVQRLNRGSRIGSNVGGTLTVKTFVAPDTIEAATIRLWQRRNEWSDQLQDHGADETDPFFMSARMRAKLIHQAKQLAKLQGA